MEQQNLTDFVRFSDDSVLRETVFETLRLWSQVVCLSRAQTFGPVADEDSDAIFTILAGEAVFLVDGKRKRLSQWGAVLVPAGANLTIKNASVDPLVLLLTAAPPPVPHEDVP
jgi:mannose-6-phosphate isomerase-like protein (cupin superfamily)